MALNETSPHFAFPLLLAQDAPGSRFRKKKLSTPVWHLQAACDTLHFSPVDVTA